MSQEYDYYGVEITTIDDDTCSETMENIIYGIDSESRYLTEKEKKSFKKTLVDKHSIYPSKHYLDSIMTIDDTTIYSNKFKNILTDIDKNLLIEYSPKLFNTLSSPETLKENVFELVNLFYIYRLNNSPKYGINYIRKHSPSFGANKSRTEKEKDLVKKINQVIDLMGGDFYHKDTNTIHINPNTNKMQESDEPKATEIKDLLKRVRDNPSAYIPSKPLKPSANKNNIKDYLFKLELANKTDTIEAFIKAIK